MSGSNIKNQVSYKRNEVDVFKGRSLLECEGFQLKQLKRFKIRNLQIGERPDGWQGDYIDIGLTNGTRFCDIELRPGICVKYFLSFPQKKLSRDNLALRNLAKLVFWSILPFKN